MEERALHREREQLGGLWGHNFQPLATSDGGLRQVRSDFSFLFRHLGLWASPCVPAFLLSLHLHFHLSSVSFSHDIEVIMI